MRIAFNMCRHSPPGPGQPGDARVLVGRLQQNSHLIFGLSPLRDDTDSYLYSQHSYPRRLLIPTPEASLLFFQTFRIWHAPFPIIFNQSYFPSRQLTARLASNRPTFF